MKRLERVVESVARSPRWLADDDLPLALRQFEFVNRGDGALPSADIADDQEMFREVDRIKDREDRKRRFPAFVSRSLPLSRHSIIWDSGRALIIIDNEFVASQGRLRPCRMSFT